MTWAGSVNMTDGAMLNNDELMLRTRKPEIFAEAQQFFYTVEASESGISS